jgi:hypothetical protein
MLVVVIMEAVVVEATAVVAVLGDPDKHLK